MLINNVISKTCNKIKFYYAVEKVVEGLFINRLAIHVLVLVLLLNKDLIFNIAISIAN